MYNAPQIALALRPDSQLRGRSAIRGVCRPSLREPDDCSAAVTRLLLDVVPKLTTVVIASVPLPRYTGVVIQKFKPNPYFADTALSRRTVVTEDGEVIHNGSTIRWKPDKV